ncbi:MAG: N-acetylglucosamine-6-phosphate deacetylase [Saprospiraceae bacterium]|nr:N-acetylglucosamine-6-phosphate deacetylase [Pyrinomonadaceae bacterium]
MNSFLLNNGNAVLSGQLKSKTSLMIEGESITAISAGAHSFSRIFDADDLTLISGFIDIHIHGAVGVDVNSADVDGLLAIAEFLAKNGVTGWVPTLVPDSDENYRRAINAIDGLMEIQSGRPVAQALGVHYEGVFANEQMCGALRPEFFKKFTGVEIAELPRLKNGVHMTTLAPEIDGGKELIGELVRQGWVVSIGHTKADTETLDEACDAGAKHLTHFYNAMTGLHHRDVGVVGWALTRNDVTFDIIADGVHVHPRMLEFACRSKTPDMVSLISDSVAPTGLGDGDYKIWGETVSVAGGKTRNERGSIAGSVITMHDAVKRMLSLGFSAVEVSKMASLNPAKLLGIQDSYGSIETGKRADLAAMDEAGNIRFVMIGGLVAVEA